MIRATATCLLGLLISTSVFAENPYKDMTLMDFIQHVSQRLELTVVISPRVKTNRPILVFVNEELPKDELYQVLGDVLEMQNFVATSHNGIVRITRDRKARSSPIPVIE